LEAKITEQIKLSMAAVPKSMWNMNDPKHIKKYFN